MAKKRKDVKVIIHALMAQGWDIAMSGGSHYRCASPNIKIPVQFISSTPSDHHAIQNMKAQLRKAGAIL